VTLSRKGSKKENQVLVHWMYKNEKTWQQESGVLPQLQGHYDAPVLKEMKKKKRKQRRKVKYINVKKCNTGASTYYLIISRTSSMNTVKRLTNILGSFVSNL
jgi:hypothetical protein